MKGVKISLLIILGIIGFAEIPMTSAYDGGLIFYDPTTKVKLLPPVITSSKSNTSMNMPPIGQPCECRTKGCGCCVGMILPAVNFDEKVCANVTRSKKQQEWVLRLYRNENQLVMYKLSSFTPPPFCIPLPLPLPIPIRMCLQVREIMFVNNMLQMCLDWIVQIFTFEIFRLHFACFRLGTGGINILPGVTAPPGLSITDEQINGDVYDPVLLDRSLKNTNHNINEFLSIYHRTDNLLGYK